MQPTPLSYRPCVVGVFIDAAERVLLLHRSDTRGAWQLPQGGIEEGEAPEVALAREMWEELGTSDFDIIGRAAETVCYDWPPFARGKYKDLYRGQEQHWFLVKFRKGRLPNLKQATDPEFDEYRFASVEDAIDSIIEWKKDAYRRGFTLLGLLSGAN